MREFVMQPTPLVPVARHVTSAVDRTAEKPQQQFGAGSEHLRLARRLSSLRVEALPHDSRLLVASVGGGAHQRARHCTFRRGLHTLPAAAAR